MVDLKLFAKYIKLYREVTEVTKEIESWNGREGSIAFIRALLSLYREKTGKNQFLVSINWPSLTKYYDVISSIGFCDINDPKALDITKYWENKERKEEDIIKIVQDIIIELSETIDEMELEELMQVVTERLEREISNSRQRKKGE